MKLRVALGTIAALTVACDHTNKNSDQASSQPATPPAAAPKPPDDMKPEPVGKAPAPTPPAPTPTPPAPAGEDDVRPPVAADLAEYVKDIKGSGALNATIETSMGTIHCTLFDDKAPMTVANFVGLATGKKPWKNPKTGNVEKGKPFFDGTTFHRVIPGFMIQGGDPLGQGVGGPGYQFGNEFDRSLQMGPGALAMANADDPSVGRVGTNGSQFFIMEGARPDLVGHHTIFGQCKEVDLVTKITNAPAERTKPNPPIEMKKVTISRGK
jgi:peptidyl-prolyl cis-trans isomerase A (cyclophilin A)